MEVVCESFTLHQLEDPFRLLARPPGNYRLHIGAGQRIYLMHRGYIKIWRKVKDSGLYQLPNAFTLFVYMLLEATHKPIRHGTVDLDRGQLVTGRHKLSAELEMSERSIRTALDHLTKLDFIASKPTNKYTIYTIVNYSKYQDIDVATDQQTDQQATSKRPATDQQPTTIQKHKHINTQEINTSSSFELPDWINKAHWEMWVKARKKMSLEQKRGQVDKLAEWRDSGLDYAGALSNAAINGTQGLFLPSQPKFTKATSQSPENFSQRDYGTGVQDL